MFAGSDTDELSELKTLHIKDIAQIKRVQGLTDEYYIHELIFKITDGTEEGRIEAYQYSLAEDDLLAEDEEIIGVYGQYKDSYIGYLSLLVWKPNKP